MATRKAKPRRATAGAKRGQTRKQAKSSSNLGNTSSQSPLVYLGAILAVTLICYIPSLSNDFVNWDDPQYFLENELVQTLDGEHFVRMWQEEVSYNYHPITALSLAVDYAIAGENMTHYHVMNLLFHLLNTALVFFFVGRLFKDKWTPIIAALIFGIHPMHVESVAWVTERKDLLYTLFFLGSLILYDRYIVEKKMGLLIAAFVVGVLSYLSKPAAITLPLVLLLMDYWHNRGWGSKVWIEKVPFFAMSILIGLITVNIQAEAAVRTFEEISFVNRFLFASYGYVMYLVKLLIPYPLYTFYAYPDMNNVPALYLSMPILAIGVTAVGLWFGSKNRGFLFGFLFFILTISITLQVVSFGAAIMSDRYSYLPYIGLGIALGWLINQILVKKPEMKTLVLGVGALAVVGLGVLTWNQTKVWKNGETLWTQVIEHSEKPVRIAYTNRGEFYKDNQQYPEALADFGQALKISPNELGTLEMRGYVFFQTQKYQECISDYSTVLRAQPENVEAMANRATAYTVTQQYEKALGDLNKVLQLRPDHAAAYRTRGYLHYATGNHPASINDYEALLKLQPNQDDILNSLALSYRQLGKHQKSLASVNQSIQLNPNQGVYYLTRAYTHQAMGQNGKARQDAQKAQSLGQNVDPTFLNSLQ